MFRGILIHVVLLIALTAALYLFKMAKQKLGLALPFIIGGVLGCAALEAVALVASSTLAGMFFEVNYDVAMYIMIGGEVVILVAVLLGAHLIVSHTESRFPGKALYLLFAGASVINGLLEYFSFKDFYDMMCRWDIMSKEEYLKITARFNTYEIVQLVVGSLMIVLVFVLCCMEMRKNATTVKKNV